MSDLCIKEIPFQFDLKEQNALSELNHILTENPVLRIYDVNCETELQTDASKDGYGAILMQKAIEDEKFHPVYYMRCKTKSEKRNYSSYELEVLVIVRALEKFRTYLLGIEFTIVTDCAAFEKTMQKKDLIL